MTSRTIKTAATNQRAGKLTKADRLFAQWSKLPRSKRGASFDREGKPKFTGVTAKMLKAIEEETGKPARLLLEVLIRRDKPQCKIEQLIEEARKHCYLDVVQFGQFGRFESLSVNAQGICLLIANGKKTFINLKQSAEWYASITQADWWDDSNENQKGLSLWLWVIAENLKDGIAVASMDKLNEWEGGAQ
jgi:hypothetical protein